MESYVLSPEAQQVYQNLQTALQKLPASTRPSADIGAKLAARHAQRCAEIIQKATGRPYTALDWYRRMEIRSAMPTRQEIFLSHGTAQEHMMRATADWDNLIDQRRTAGWNTWNDRNFGKRYRFMKVPQVLQLLGESAGDIQILGGYFDHSVRKDHPGMRSELLEHLPELMAHPIMIVEGNKDDSYMFVLDAKTKKGATLVAPVAMGRGINKGNTLHLLNSTFAKEDDITGEPKFDYFTSMMNQGKVLYLDKIKSAQWIRSYRDQSSAEAHRLYGAYKNIIANLPAKVKTETDLFLAQQEKPAFYQSMMQNGQETTQGATTFLRNGQRIVSLLETADASTFLHELAHVFLEDLKELSLVDADCAKDMETVRHWWDWRPGAAKTYRDTPWAEEFQHYETAILTAQQNGDKLAEQRAKETWRQERFARAFELHLRDGKAPAPEVQGIFSKFKRLLHRVYQDFRILGGRASPRVAQVMDRMILTSHEVQSIRANERAEAGMQYIVRETRKKGCSCKETYDGLQQAARGEVLRLSKTNAR